MSHNRNALPNFITRQFGKNKNRKSTHQTKNNIKSETKRVNLIISPLRNILYPADLIRYQIVVTLKKVMLRKINDLVVKVVEPTYSVN